MAAGGELGRDVIKHFNGNLFADAAVLDLTREEIERVAAAAALEWNTVDASIFGTLFTRGIDPQQRSQLGAQYTGRTDIETIVEPVVMTPLRREWAEVRAKADALLATEMKVGQASRLSTIEEGTGKMPVLPYKPVSAAALKKNRAAAEKLLTAFLERLKRVRVLDGAGGSGNFLYVTLQKLLDLEKEVNDYLAAHGFTPLFPQVNPSQLYLIEINTYAHSLAQVTVQIGYIQWLRVHGYGFPAEPILLRLDKNFLLADALFTDWPEVDFIVSNPPFLGDKMMRGQLGDDYVEKLRALFKDAVPGGADLCCYWFEKARAHIQACKVKRAGLLATQNIRGGASREVLKRIKESGDIFFGVSDRDWILDGASVHVSLIGFDDGSEKSKLLNGQAVATIHANLSSAADTTQANRLPANVSTGFIGSCKGGPFDIDEAEAIHLLQSAGNPHGRPNSDLVRPVVNSDELMMRRPQRWIIDNANRNLDEACLYEAPHGIVRARVKPKRDENRDRWLRENWWRPQRMRPEMREAIRGLERFLVTPTTSKHRIFGWLAYPTLPDHKLVVFARSDDYFFGLVQNRVHETWARIQGTQL
ncbi:MAG: class I SAM-dependent DNA methyltransferase, partial [Verrucomicrobia bacterium]|nr:class I SAM-dependent DNA methyltransferase [Verrucomicrobiota bacterium]